MSYRFSGATLWTRPFRRQINFPARNSSPLCICRPHVLHMRKARSPKTTHRAAEQKLTACSRLAVCACLPRALDYK